MGDCPRFIGKVRFLQLGNLFVIDSSVIIDYWAIEPLVLKLISKHLGPVTLPEPLLDEVKGFNHRDCSTLRIEVIEPVLEDYTFVASRPAQGLSEKDLICLHTAIRTKAICITGDKILWKACKGFEVNPMWGLRPMVNLVKVGVLEHKEALYIARSIQAQNVRIPVSVLKRFEQQIATAMAAAEKKAKK